jgi:endonuclease YncB( thermonuclease family)
MTAIMHKLTLALLLLASLAHATEPHYRSAKVVRVIDGNTVVLCVELATEKELGYSLAITTSARLYGINAPDASKEGPERTKAATAYLVKLIAELPDGACQVELRGRDKYGRCLVRIVSSGVDLNQKMLDAGHAVVYLP